MLKRPWQAETVLPTSVLLATTQSDSSGLDTRSPEPFDLTELEKNQEVNVLRYQEGAWPQQNCGPAPRQRAKGKHAHIITT